MIAEVLGLSGVLLLGGLDLYWIEAAARRASARPRATGDERCPYCHVGLTADLGPDARVVSCARCGTGHHGGCWGEHAGCSVHGCGRSSARREGAEVEDPPAAGDSPEREPAGDAAPADDGAGPSSRTAAGPTDPAGARIRSASPAREGAAPGG